MIRRGHACKDSLGVGMQISFGETRDRKLPELPVTVKRIVFFLRGSRIMEFKIRKMRRRMTSDTVSGSKKNFESFEFGISKDKVLFMERQLAFVCRDE